MTENQGKITTNWTGEMPEQEQLYEKVVVKEGEHIGIFKELKIVQTLNFNKTAKQNTFLFTVELPKVEDEEPKTLPYYLNPKISKGSTNVKTGDKYSNSKLFDLLVSADLVDKAKEAEKDQNGFNEASLQLFLSQNLIGKKVRFSTKTLHKDDDDKRYSAVDKIYELISEEA